MTNAKSTIEKTTIHFVATGSRCSITMELRPVETAGKLDLDLKPAANAIELSLTGTCAGGAGQCTDRIREAGSDDKRVVRVCDIWDRWHLNSLVAGNRTQERILKNHPEAKTYDEKRAVLAKARRLKSDGYEYGSAWLLEKIPPAIITELKTLLAALDGARIGDAPSVDDAPEIDGDIIDSRDVVKRIEIYREAVTALGLAPDIRDADLNEDELGDKTELADELVRELNALTDLEDQARGCGDWEFGATLIRDSHFTEYAEQTAEETGAINRDSRWPNNHIDWDAAAEELKQDYSRVTFRGDTYWVR